jgi:hypothetical protein
MPIALIGNDHQDPQSVWICIIVKVFVRFVEPLTICVRIEPDNRYILTLLVESILLPIGNVSAIHYWSNWIVIGRRERCDGILTFVGRSICRGFRPGCRMRQDPVA